MPHCWKSHVTAHNMPSIIYENIKEDVQVIWRTSFHLQTDELANSLDRWADRRLAEHISPTLVGPGFSALV